MPVIEEVIRIQSYLRENVSRNSEVVALPPFTLFFHPVDRLKYFNYAIPDEPIQSDLGETALRRLRVVLGQLRGVFRQRSRVARFEFFEAFAPGLAGVLRASGFIEEDRLWSMLCTTATARPAPDVPELEMTALGPDSSAADLRDFMIAQRQGFNPEDLSEPSPEDLEQTREDFGQRGWRAFLARINGEPAGVSLFSRPLSGICEVAGIATRPAFRRRGIATQLTWQAIRAAFDLGVQTTCLTAANEAAGRVYERVGFTPFSTMLAYIDAENGES